MIYTGETPNARYGRIVLRIYTALNRLLRIVGCAGAWFFNARANSHGIAPNTTLGFARSTRWLLCTDGTSHNGSDFISSRSLPPPSLSRCS